MPLSTTLPPPVRELMVSLVLSCSVAPGEITTPAVEPRRPAEPPVATIPAVIVVTPA